MNDENQTTEVEQAFAPDDMLFSTDVRLAKPHPKPGLNTFWKKEKPQAKGAKEKKEQSVEKKPVISMAQRVSQKLKKEAQKKEKMQIQQQINGDMTKSTSSQDQKLIKMVKEGFQKQIDELTKSLIGMTQQRDELQEKLSVLYIVNQAQHVEISLLKKYNGGGSASQQRVSGTSADDDGETAEQTTMESISERCLQDFKRQTIDLQEALEENAKIKEELKQLKQKFQGDSKSQSDTGRSSQILAGTNNNLLKASTTSENKPFKKRHSLFIGDQHHTLFDKKQQQPTLKTPTKSGQKSSAKDLTFKFGGKDDVKKDKKSSGFKNTLIKSQTMKNLKTKTKSEPIEVIDLDDQLDHSDDRQENTRETFTFNAEEDQSGNAVESTLEEFRGRFESCTQDLAEQYNIAVEPMAESIDK